MFQKSIFQEFTDQISNQLSDTSLAGYEDTEFREMANDLKKPISDTFELLRIHSEEESRQNKSSNRLSIVAIVISSLTLIVAIISLIMQFV